MTSKRKRIIDEIRDVPDDFSLAVEKSRELIQNKDSYLKKLKRNSSFLTNAFYPTVIFAQYECGGGVCIRSNGLILSVAHVLGDEPTVGTEKLAIFVDGTIVLTKAIKVNEVCDVAILQIVGQYSHEGQFITKPCEYPFTILHDQDEISKRKQLVCFGQPGRDDLESSKKKKTNFDLLTISTGVYISCLEGDIMDNSDIGKLKHDCWTYWGHSGAGLFETKRGSLIGLHSSWDDETGTRHGIHLKAVRQFVEEYLE